VLNLVERKYTNRDIAEAFHISLYQVRRWAVVALGIDVEADRGKGSRRNYSIDEAFKIYLTALLCSEYNMSLSQATYHLNNIWPVLIDYHLLPSQMPLGIINKACVDFSTENKLQIIIDQLHYELRFLHKKVITEDKNNSGYFKTYKIVIFRKARQSTEILLDKRHSTRTWINYDNELGFFINFLKIAFFENLKEYRLLSKLSERFDLRKKMPLRRERFG
jgi:hypothetical protein